MPRMGRSAPLEQVQDERLPAGDRFPFGGQLQAGESRHDVLLHGLELALEHRTAGVRLQGDRKLSASRRNSWGALTSLAEVIWAVRSLMEVKGAVTSLTEVT